MKILHMEVVEWSARLARKRTFRVRRLLAPLSMMYIPLLRKKKKENLTNESKTKYRQTITKIKILNVNNVELCLNVSKSGFDWFAEK